MASKQNVAKFTAWTSTGMEMEATGNIAGYSLELFGLVATTEARAKLIESILARHVELNKLGA